MFGMIPFVKAAGRGLGALIKGRKGKETLEKEVKDRYALSYFKNLLWHMASLSRNLRSQ